MNPQKLVASLEISKEYVRLMKEKGREMPHSYFWYEMLDLKDWEKEQGVEDYCLSIATDEPVKTTDIPALTSGEIGMLLPGVLNSDTDDEMFLAFSKEEDGWRVHYETTDSKWESIIEPTEADARLKMLNYLLTNNLV